MCNDNETPIFLITVDVKFISSSADPYLKHTSRSFMALISKSI